MKAEHRAILEALEGWLQRHPEQRFTQALFNLGINEFLDPSDPEARDYALRDPYNDADAAVLERIRKQLRTRDPRGRSSEGSI